MRKNEKEREEKEDRSGTYNAWQIIGFAKKTPTSFSLAALF